MPSSKTTEATYRIAVVCLGNICRSPMADVVLNAHLRTAGLSDRVSVDSYGTGGWHHGQRMDRRAASTLESAGYDASAHRARQITPALLVDYDLVLAMDAENLADLKQLNRRQESHRPSIRLFRSFDPDVTHEAGEVPDPYYGGPEGFEEVLAMVERTAGEIVRLGLDGSLP